MLHEPERSVLVSNIVRPPRPPGWPAARTSACASTEGSFSFGRPNFLAPPAGPAGSPIRSRNTSYHLDHRSARRGVEPLRSPCAADLDDEHERRGTRAGKRGRGRSGARSAQRHPTRRAIASRIRGAPGRCRVINPARATRIRRAARNDIGDRSLPRFLAAGALETARNEGGEGSLPRKVAAARQEKA